MKWITITFVAVAAVILLPSLVLAQDTTTPKIDHSEARLDHSSIKNMLQPLRQLREQLQALIDEKNKKIKSLRTEHAKTLTPEQLGKIEMENYRQLAKLENMLQKVNTQINNLEALLHK
jgi:hypothetical protein